MVERKFTPQELRRMFLPSVTPECRPEANKVVNQTSAELLPNATIHDFIPVIIQGKLARRGIKVKNRIQNRS